MPAPRKPTHLLNKPRHDERLQAAPEVKPPQYEASLDDVVMPEGMSKKAQRVWPRVVSTLVRSGIMSIADEEALALYCENFAEMREAEAVVSVEGNTSTGSMGQTIINPNWKIMMELRKRHAAYLSAFGMDPASRSKVRKLPAKPMANGVPSKGGTFAAIKAGLTVVQPAAAPEPKAKKGGKR